jgi:N-acetylmuramoyl-L-alanine amidase
MNSIKLVALIFITISINYSFSQSDDFTVVIDAGHGGKDPGNTGNGYLEKKIALNISLKLGKQLENQGIKVVYTRKKDVFVNLFERANIANKSNAHLFLSIHCDAHTSQAYGAGTFVLGLHANSRNFEVAKKENSVIFFEEDYINKYDGFDPSNPESVIGLTLMQEEYLDQSITAASYIQNSFVARLKRKNRNVKQAGFIVLKYTYMPSVLIETGFLTNKTEGSYLNSNKGQSEMADAISNAVIKYRNDFYNNLSASNLINNQDTDTVYYGVQIAASKKLLELKPYNFNGLKSVDVVRDGEIYKYLYGKHKTLEEANKALKTVKGYGFNSSFVVTYQNNKIQRLN